ncbi:BMP family ABC transporter substrate-binding protein [Microbacterium sp. Root180]|uniref:BMP family ABC transporter substrate-binding protein n=1 Tax=Microbacterium sp. Root180 TaxID=1736483 RepID=UPI0006F32403|nr:BMP family ABC transporter substrate-binding protein [Microbacterium sp. Root180]KRB36637.1 hypothetical protein ASD93_11325 [Microbacterium sp. Root180]
MASRNRRSVLLVALASAALLTLTGCGQSPAAPDSGDEPLKVALVTPEKAGDGGPTDQMLAGLAQAEEEYGIETRHIEATDPSTFESTISNLCQAGTDVAFIAFTQFTDAIKAVAPNCTKTKIVHLYADPYEPELENVRSVSYDTNGPAYLAGVLAAASTKTGKVGFVGGEALPQVNADYHAFAAGVEATDPDVEITGLVVGSWTDQVKGQQVGQSLFGRGIDYVLAYGGGASLGVVKAAQDAGSIVVYDGQVTEQISDVVSSTATQQFGTSIFNEVGEIVAGTWKPGHVVAGLADGGVVLAPNDLFITSGSEEAVAAFENALPEIEDVKQQIIDGEVEIPFNTDGF